MSKVQIKICGVTSVGDARACAALGANMIGLNFYPRSPRFITPERAREIVANTESGLRAIGVFVDAKVDEIRAIARQTGIRSVQLHGAATPHVCAQLAGDFTVIRALNTGEHFQPDDTSEWNGCDILLDAYHPQLHGGTGMTCDWEAARTVARRARFFILSGGLNARNVSEAISVVRPNAVDVCSGVESAPGVKSYQAIEQFVAAVRGAK